ncbi:MAG: NUDIX domain-containing protein [Pseudomonadota bacterium]
MSAPLPFDAALADAPLGRLSAALVIAFDAEGRVLCQLRDDRPDVAGPGLWSLFGGSAEPGETRRQAAMREFAEETGLAVGHGALEPFRRFETDRGVEHAVFRLRLAIAPADVRLREGAGFALLTAAQVEDYPFLENARTALRLHLAEG